MLQTDRGLKHSISDLLVHRAQPELLFALGIVCGVALRLYQITNQIIADDEWHALHALLAGNYSKLISHFGGADYCIPLAVLYKFTANRIGLSEMLMRAPMLGFGIASLVVFPLLVRREVGRTTSDAFTWLLAISPIHIYFSRYARPYSITMFLAFVGSLAFFNWWFYRGKWWAWLYIFCAIIGPFFHLAVLPVLLAPLLFGFICWVLGGDRSRFAHLRELLASGGIILVGLTVLLALPIFADLQALTAKTGRSSVTWKCLAGVSHLMAGTDQRWLIIGTVVTATAGGIFIFQSRSRFFAYLVFLMFVQVTSCMLSGLDGLHIPIVLARYCLPCLPILLLCLAAGLAKQGQLLGKKIGAHAPGMIMASVSALLFYFGPLPHIYYRPNSWTNHALFQYYYETDVNNGYVPILHPPEVPRFYWQLADFPKGRLLIVEAPWYYEWHNVHYPYYQQIHRQRMNIGFVGNFNPPSRPGELPTPSKKFHFRNFVHVSDHETLRRRGVKYVIFHNDLKEEIPNRNERVPVDVGPWIRQYTEVYGSAVYQDREVTVFDVARASAKSLPSTRTEKTPGKSTNRTREPW